MNRVIQLGISLLVVAWFADLASAQVVHDHRKKKAGPAPVDITSYAPTSGVAGSRVEIRGVGFAPGDQISLGNLTLAPVVLEPTRIVVAIPAGAGSGLLVLVRGGNRLVASRGSFTVLEAAPVITAIEPERAPPGATIRIRGGNLATIHSVLMGKQPLAIRGKGPDFLQVTLPAKATAGDYLWVKGPGGQARSAAPYPLEVLPSVRSIEPRFARPGDTITLHGASFAGGDKVLLGGQALHIGQLFADRIVAVLPPAAATGALVIERGPHRVIAAARYEVIQRPVIVAVTPNGGPEKTPVTVQVRFDSPDLALLYGATALHIERRTPQPDGSVLLQFTVPRGATDQVVSVRSRGGEDRWVTPFAVHVYPVVTAVQPARAWERTDITITGMHLGRAETVMLAGVPLKIVSRTPRALVASLPPNAVDGAISLGAYGQRFDTRFTVDVVQRAVIDRFTPASGMPGSEVLITGNHFQATTRVWLGKQEMPIVRAALPTQIWVRVPAEATGPERISVGEGEVVVTARDPFVAIAAPAISGFSPRIGKPGMEVVVTGNQLGGQVQILLGNTPLTITRVEQGLVAVRLPVTMPVGSHHFQIKAGGTVVARSRQPLQVVPSAMIRMFTPRKAQPGHQVHIKGTGFDADTRVLFGKTELPVVKRGPHGAQLWAEIPLGLSGTDYVIIDDHGVRSQTEAMLTIDAAGPPPPPPPPAKGPVIHDHRKKK